MKKLRDLLNIYFQKTTLHGFSYLAGSGNWADKTFWLLLITFSLICCTSLCLKLVLKVQKYPIVVDRPDTAVHVKNIPFPAVSICPGLAKNGDSDILTIMSELNETKYQGYAVNKCKFLHTVELCQNNSLDWAKYEMALQYAMLLDISWMRTNEVPPTFTVSQFGLCKTFNIIGHEEMFRKKSVAEYFRYQNLSFLVSPQFTPKKEAGYVSYIRLPTKAFFFCNIKIGCNYDALMTHVVIHPPDEMPDFRHRKELFKAGELVKVSIEAQIKITDETLMDLDVDSRRCYKLGERNLKYFKIYSSVNCLKECESDFIMKRCRCVPYYFINGNLINVCNSSQIDKCFRPEYENFDAADCKCYPTCTDIAYETTTHKVYSQMSISSERDLPLMKIVANFKYDSFYPQIRRKYFTMIDWFSNIGGILGLFFGFSFLSAFEIFFHIFRGVLEKAKSNKENRILRAIKFKKARRYLKNFMDISSIHGFSYISDTRIKVLERLAWLTSFTLSLSACAYMIIKLNQKLKIDSILIANGNEYVNLTEIPFPAVTFMSTLLDYNVMIMENFMLNQDSGWDYDENNADNLMDLELAAISVNAEGSRFKLKEDTRSRNLTDYGDNIVPHMKQNIVTKYFEIMKLTWDEKYSVKTATLLTTMRFGNSFNIAPAEEIFDMKKIHRDFTYNHENNFKGGPKNKSQPYPWTSLLSNLEPFVMSLSTFTYTPFVYIHSPFDVPLRFSKEESSTFEITAGSTHEILIEPQIVRTNDEFKALPIQQRMCFMDGERKLKFFKIYTQKSCELECLSKTLLDSCNCVPFDVIRGNTSRVCELNDYVCVHKVQNEIFIKRDTQEFCNCLQPCNHIAYSFEYVVTRHQDPDSGAIVKFRFKDDEFLAMERVRQFTIQDFLSYIGGLLGLFAGISALSLFEVFNFFTLRLFCEIFLHLRRDRKIDFRL